MDGSARCFGNKKDVLAQPVKNPVGHALRYLRLVIIYATLGLHQLLAKLATGYGGSQSLNVALGWKHLGRIQCCLPSVLQRQVQYQVVGKGTFTRVRLSHYNHRAPWLKLYVPVEFTPPYGFAWFDAVLPNVFSPLTIVVDSLNTHNRARLGVVNALQHGIHAVIHQHLVGILSCVFTYAPFHYATAGLAKV